MALQHPKGPYAGYLTQFDEVFTYETARVPRCALPAGEMPAEVAY